MQLQLHRILLPILLLVGMVLNGYSQNIQNTYSVLGAGIRVGDELNHNRMKGGVGLSNGYPWAINNLNPALLPMNIYSTFDVGFTLENRSYTSDTLNESGTGGSLDYIAIALPLKENKWSMVLGLKPYTFVSYNFTSSNSISGSSIAARYDFIGDGGINQLYAATGVKIIKGLSLGVRVSYLFGSITQQVTSTLPADTLFSVPNSYFVNGQYSDFAFEGSVAYLHDFNEKSTLGVGVVYDFQTNIKGKTTDWLGTSIDPEVSDSIIVLNDRVSRSYTIPDNLGIGISYTKKYKYSFATDFYFSDWSKFRNLAGTNEGFGNSFIAKVGADFTPDINSVKSYFSRITYMLGGYYERTPYTANNETLINFGMNFGLSLPVGGASTLNLGFEGGRIGDVNKGQVEENYFKLFLSVSFSDRSYGWYRKQRRYN